MAKAAHEAAMKHCLRYLKGTTSLGLIFTRSSPKIPKIIGYSDSSHNIDPDDGRSTAGHIFYLGESLITWCSVKQETVALSSCEAEFMAGTEAAKQAIWLQELLSEVMDQAVEKAVIRIDNQSAIALTKNPADILTKALGRIKFKEMKELIGMQDLEKNDFKLKWENVEISLKIKET
ncbi:secreted RxLR effector protein 161-like [Brassica rapa]|uniref:secreted RxLR effector protein 161-like n=1 Tax=Brassica campestris TaxID=3711 RepID=UPI00142E54B7|nr:secreted RxLR effector protein 161-like [Brassica rapa]